jgi:tetratricopeptide (TPR) repeat protein
VAGARAVVRGAAPVVAVVASILAGWIAWRAMHDREPSLDDGAHASPAVRAEYVGAARCAACHRAEHDAWRGSQHAHAMQVASDSAVLGDFGGAPFTEGAVTSRFFRRGGGYWVRTDGPDGRLADFRIAYTFGVYPLQQYLVAMPGGRLQALSIAWDARPPAEGGQRWFHLYPGQGIEHGSELHWSGLQQNWNFMCADCHSTNVRKGYDAAANTFHTTWSEIDVSCEACHGPGSRHVAWARWPRWAASLLWRDRGLAARLDERRDVRWTIDAGTGTARRSRPPATHAEVEVCAACHSRRAQVAEPYVAGMPLLDAYLPSPILPGLYHPDGQQKDEVYTYGSFLQSRMYHAGVTCSDCHEPHSQRLRAEGNAVCARCHATSRFDTPQHHHHARRSEGARCVACHMPATTYMQVDPRRDHGIRVPRPDRSLALGVPDACTSCHAGRGAAWAVLQLQRWNGHQPEGFQRFAGAFAAHERRAPGAESALLAVAADTTEPAFVRASSLARLAGSGGPAAVDAARAALGDPDPQVRHAALSVMETLPAEQRARFVAPMLRDSIRAVRTEAAWLLAPATRALSEDEARDFARASAEFVAGQRLQADRPEARTTLGTYFASLSRLPDAEAEFRAALRLFPRAAPAWLNLADVYRAQGRDADAERVLREGLSVVPRDPSLHGALGLAYARAGRLPEAVAELARAASLDPSARNAYAYAVALHSTGRPREAIRALEAALVRYPGDRDLLYALATFQRDAGERAAARRTAERLLRAHPGDGEAQALLQSLPAGAE